mgnify:CR=1 FL=1
MVRRARMVGVWSAVEIERRAAFLVDADGRVGIDYGVYGVPETYVIDKAGVICTPGASFGPSGEGYVRFALTMPVEKIGEAVQAIKSSGILG